MMDENSEQEQVLTRLEDHKHALAKALEDHKAQLSESLEKRQFENEKLLAVWRAVFDFGQITLRTVIVANGAGAIAILAYLGNVAKNGPSPIPNSAAMHYLGAAAGLFALGVAAGFVAAILAYLSQYNVVKIADETGQKAIPGTRWERQAALISVFVGLGTFLTGVCLAIWAYVFS